MIGGLEEEVEVGCTSRAPSTLLSDVFQGMLLEVGIHCMAMPEAVPGDKGIGGEGIERGGL